MLGYGDNNQFDECGGDDGLMRARYKSLSRCIYWSAMTITTVVRLSSTGVVRTLHVFSLPSIRVLAQGYGDMHPCTPTGQMIAVIWGFFGVAVVALPSGIIGSGLVDVMAEAKEKKAAAKRLSQIRASKAVASTRGSVPLPTADELRDPTRFHDLGLAMLLPPGTVPSSNPLSASSPQTRANGGPSSLVAGENGGTPRTNGESLMKRLERSQEEGRARALPRQKGRKNEAAGGGGGESSPRPGVGDGRVPAHLLDERGQLDLASESVIRGCAALLFPGEFVFDPSAERAAWRGIQLAEELGATTAADIASVQQALVRKLAREYLKARFRDALTVEQTVAQELPPQPCNDGDEHGDPARSQLMSEAPGAAAAWGGTDPTFVGSD